MEQNKDRMNERIGYAFASPALLEEALRHSSRANESPGSERSNERLEFLGDAVLELCISEELFTRFPDADEGRMTTYRAMLVNERTLAGLARELGLDQALMLGRGEESQGGRQRPSLLSDVFEALLGAIFLDGGYPAARDWVSRRYEGLWPNVVEMQPGKDGKTLLQEVTQQRFRDRPVYILEQTTGPEHDRTFHVLLRLPTGQEFRDQGGSVKKAEQRAALKALQFLDAESKQ